MAFGDLLGALLVGNTSVTNPMVAVGTVSVSVGDLIVAFGAETTNLTITACTDNLGNSYTAQNAGTDGGSITGRMFYSKATAGGTLTAVNGTFTASTDDAVLVAAVFSKGPNGFAASPVDANPTNISGDTTTPYTCPATGTLAQASELVVCAFAQGTTAQIINASSPNLMAASKTSAVGGSASGSIGYQVVTANTSIAPSFTAGGTVASSTLHTISFKEAAALSKTPYNPWPLLMPVLSQ